MKDIECWKGIDGYATCVEIKLDVPNDIQNSASENHKIVPQHVEFTETGTY